MSLQILLADDSVPAQNMGKKILAEAGYDVLTVSNGLEAMRKIADKKPDLAILDIFMPGYGGLELCERLRGAAATADLPIVLTVGKLEPYRPEEARQAKASAVIVKPFSAAELLSVVQNLMDGVSAPVPAEASPVDETPVAPAGPPRAASAPEPVSAPAPAAEAESPAPPESATQGTAAALGFAFDPDAKHTPFRAAVADVLVPEEAEAAAEASPAADFSLEPSAEPIAYAAGPEPELAGMDISTAEKSPGEGAAMPLDIPERDPLMEFGIEARPEPIAPPTVSAESPLREPPPLPAPEELPEMTDARKAAFDALFAEAETPALDLQLEHAKPSMYAAGAEEEDLLPAISSTAGANPMEVERDEEIEFSDPRRQESPALEHDPLMDVDVEREGDAEPGAAEAAVLRNADLDPMLIDDTAAVTSLGSSGLTSAAPINAEFAAPTTPLAVMQMPSLSIPGAPPAPAAVVDPVKAEPVAEPTTIMPVLPEVQVAPVPEVRIAPVVEVQAPPLPAVEAEPLTEVLQPTPVPEVQAALLPEVKAEPVAETKLAPPAAAREPLAEAQTAPVAETAGHETSVFNHEAAVFNEVERVQQAVDRVFVRYKPLLVAAIVRELARRDN